MDNFNGLLPLLNEVINGIGRHFGSKCELVIHDYKNEFEHTIVSIVNGEVTGRQIGECATSIGLKLYSGHAISDSQTDGVFNYLSQTKDGKLLRSSTVYLHNNEGELIGSLCINDDITDVKHAINTMNRYISVDENPHEKENKQTIFVGKIDDLLNTMIMDSIDQVGVPVCHMTKKQKMEGIRILRDKGVFKIQKAADITAQYYGVSKFTIYNYLNEIELENDSILS